MFYDVATYNMAGSGVIKVAFLVKMCKISRAMHFLTKSLSLDVGRLEHNLHIFAPRNAVRWMIWSFCTQNSAKRENLKTFFVF